MRLIHVPDGDEPAGALLALAVAFETGAELEPATAPAAVLADASDFHLSSVAALETPEGKLHGAVAIARYLAAGSPLEPALGDAALDLVEFCDLAGPLPDVAPGSLAHLALAARLLTAGQEEHPVVAAAVRPKIPGTQSALSRAFHALRGAQPAKLGKVKKMLGQRAGNVDPNDLPRRARPALPSEVLPVEGQRNVLVTSALPYVNNVPHLGNIIGSTLSADVFARYCRLRGYNTIYICGTDEYGTASETAARKEGLTPRQVCDRYRAKHIESYDFFELAFDHFGRTSCEDPHDAANASWPQTEIAQDIFLRLQRNGHLLARDAQMTYCVQCDTGLADRMVNGTCPKCGYDDARGDQCDGCAELLNAVELVNPRCSFDASHTVEVRDTRHMYIDLSRLQPQIQAHFDRASVEGGWPENAVSVTGTWLRDGLEPRCITRDLRWGTPVPLEEFSNKVFYVWFDAPIGYISITANYTPNWQQWWKNPDNVELYQFMGKDNIPFHTLIFPGSCIGADDNYTLLKHASTTDYLNYEQAKFSKSRGVGVFGDMAASTGIPSEVWRYYLLASRPETGDSQFLWTDFAERNNNELLKNLGNLCHRAASFTYSRFDQRSPRLGALEPRDEETIGIINGLLEEYFGCLEAVHLRDGLKICMRISAEGNRYLQDTTPWVLLKNGDRERAGTVLLGCLAIVRLLTAVLDPYMPGFADKALHILNVDHATAIPATFGFDQFPEDHPLNEPHPIFRVISEAEVEDYRARFSGQQ